MATSEPAHTLAQCAYDFGVLSDSSFASSASIRRFSVHGETSSMYFVGLRGVFKTRSLVCPRNRNTIYSRQPRATQKYRTTDKDSVFPDQQSSTEEKETQKQNREPWKRAATREKSQGPSYQRKRIEDREKGSMTGGIAIRSRI